MQNGEIIDVSIIIPHFNTPKLLHKLILSIPNIPNIEVIVIDDNSTEEIDELNKCIQEFTNRNVSFIKNNDNGKGAGGARNAGLKKSKGQWLLFADADDYFLPDFWNVLSQNVDGDEDIIYFSPISVMINTNIESDRHKYYAGLIKEYIHNPCIDKEIYLRYAYWSPCSKLVRRDIVNRNKIEFDEVLHSNDMLFSAKIGLYARKIKAVDIPIYCITQSEKSLTADSGNKSQNIRKNILCNYYFFLNKHLSREKMKILGYTSKDSLYFRMYRIGIIKIRDILFGILDRWRV